MANSRIVYRVAGDFEDSIGLVHEGFVTTGWTITARFTKPDDSTYTRTAEVDVVGSDGMPAEYHIPFQSGDMTEGDHEWDLHYAHTTLADFSLPRESRQIMRVRAA